MSKGVKNYLINYIKRVNLRRNGVLIHKNCTFSSVNFNGKAIVEPYCRLLGDPIITIGDNFYMNAGCHFLGEITIGNDVQIGPKTIIWARDHGLKRDLLIREQPHYKKPVFIGDDVWIGANVTILKGVTIGTGAVVGAGSIVVKDIPDYGIAVGNPAKVVKYRV
ncbi:acyltransferase [Methanogenium organophilum]|uniref:Acyltransferase n=1 Tax=Methanogenium organophilum TaxID=2199 RepID=A0A9X9T888_METOG|nr:acyltransferase [Methanogenium organophilum]WAI01196.1 acyltransferase [Methanogenium organophilum]